MTSRWRRGLVVSGSGWRHIAQIVFEWNQRKQISVIMEGYEIRRSKQRIKSSLELKSYYLFFLVQKKK